jgi:hypothetical protein
MQITEGAGGFAAFWTARSGLRDGQNTMIIKPARVRPVGHTRRQKYVNEVAGFLVAG